MNYKKLQFRIRKTQHWLKRLMLKGLNDYDVMIQDAYYKTAASKLGLSYRELGGVLEFSHNNVKRRILHCAVDLDSVATYAIAGNKPLVLRMLKENGVPIADFYEMSHLDLEEAYQKASLFSGRIVIKPARGTANARGVSVGINKDDKKAIKKAFWKAAIHSPSILMESHVEGENYRFLVCNNKLLSVSIRTKPFVIGDGQSSLEELVKKENAKRLANISLLPEVNHPLKFPIEPNYDVPKAHGFGPRDVVRNGEKVVCLDVVDMSLGSSAYDVTDSVHPKLAELAIKTAEITGVNLGGVDILCTDISVAPEESGAKVNEINTTPGLTTHYEVENQENARDVAELILKEMFGI